MSLPLMKRSVCIVQQGVWYIPKESMPLAAGYLKATAMACETIRDEMDIRILNFNGQARPIAMAEELFTTGVPDVLAFSVLGWNYHKFGAIVETYKQIRPDGWVIFGGTHVAHQASRVFRQYPDVDIVVNTEGEFIFRDILLALLKDGRKPDLSLIDGISFQISPDEAMTTPTPERIQDLSRIPSPLLTGALPLTDSRGEFRYDVALMETNRGCPYSCSFCYWGGAIGQKVRAFPMDRLRAELELLAHHQVHTIALCDANFGMFRQDLEFVEEAIQIRELYGYPRSIESSWAKNKSKIFYEIVRRMKSSGMCSSFTLALQTLHDPALDTMRRRNMKVNEWEELAAWLRKEGMEYYAELIWGAPGETVDSFLEGYDRIAKYTSRVAIYPLLVLPNSEYSKSRDEFDLTTIRGEEDDFEYVLSHNTMTIADNVEMKPFILWSRAFCENLVLRHIWAPLRELAGITQSTVMRDMIEWFGESTRPVASRVASVAMAVQQQPGAVAAFHRALLAEPELDLALEQWWEESIYPRLPPQYAELLTEVFRFDRLTHPIFDPPEAAPPSLPVIELQSEYYYRRSGVILTYDVPAVLKHIRAGEPVDPSPRATTISICYRTGYHKYFGNHEEGVYFEGKIEGIDIDPSANTMNPGGPPTGQPTLSV